MAKDQWEEEAIERFRGFIGNARGATFAITGRDVIVNPETRENFDYQLTSEKGEKIAVELFRLVESEQDLAKNSTWYAVIGAIKEELVKLGTKGYMVDTPLFTVRKNSIKQYAVDLARKIDLATKANPTAKEFTSDGMEFHKYDELETVVLSRSDGVRSIDSRGTASQGFGAHLPKKNKQIAIADHERILLVVNWAFFVDSHDAIRAMSSIDFEQFKNVDQIFFEGRPETFSLIFDRSVVDAIKARTEVKNPEALKLLVQYITHQLADKNQNAFDFIKVAGNSSGNLNWLSDRTAKENLIRFGEDLVLNNSLEDAMWIVRMLQNDSNPSATGENDLDDPKGEHNYHQRLLTGKEVRNITTVRGYLCWLMAKIIGRNRPEYYTEIIAIISRYFEEENLYVRAQALVPLTELFERRKALRNQDGSSFDWKPEERALVRRMALEVFRTNAKYPRVLEGVLHLFDKLRDLNEKEAEELLRVMIATDDKEILHYLAALVIYFALFRKNDYKEEGSFSPDTFISILKEQIVNGNTSMKTSLAWHFWKILEKKYASYADIKSYLMLFWGDKYDYSVASSFGLIFEQMALLVPEDAKDLFERMVALLKKYIGETTPPPHQWWIHCTEEIILLFASEPDRLVALVRDLKNVWLKGIVYIGNLSVIFQTYLLVPASDRDRVKSEFMRIYEEMKAAHPYIQAVDWNK